MSCIDHILHVIGGETCFSCRFCLWSFALKAASDSFHCAILRRCFSMMCQKYSFLFSNSWKRIAEIVLANAILQMSSPQEIVSVKVTQFHPVLLTTIETDAEVALYLSSNSATGIHRSDGLSNSEYVDDIVLVSGNSDESQVFPDNLKDNVPMAWMQFAQSGSEIPLSGSQTLFFQHRSWARQISFISWAITSYLRMKWLCVYIWLDWRLSVRDICSVSAKSAYWSKVDFIVYGRRSPCFTAQKHGRRCFIREVLPERGGRTILAILMSMERVLELNKLVARKCFVHEWWSTPFVCVIGSGWSKERTPQLE